MLGFPDSFFVNRLFKLSAASWSSFSKAWAYIFNVVPELLCPSRFDTVTTSWPFEISKGRGMAQSMKNISLRTCFLLFLYFFIFNNALIVILDKFMKPFWWCIGVHTSPKSSVNTQLKPLLFICGLNLFYLLFALYWDKRWITVSNKWSGWFVLAL